MVKIMKAFALTLFLLFFASPVFSEDCALIFFYSPTCPHCKKEKVFLKEMERKYPALKIQSYDYGEENAKFKKLMQEMGSVPVGVPRTIVANKVFVGFSEESGDLKYLNTYQAYKGYYNQIETAIAACVGVHAAPLSENAPFSWYHLLIAPALLFGGYLIFYSFLRNKIQKKYLLAAFFGTIVASLYAIAQTIPEGFVLGFSETFAFPLFTFVLAFFDGFNPCSFAVLAILLSLLIYSKSKTRMALIGITFITTSAVMYFLFIIVLLTLRVELLGGYQTPMRMAVGTIALSAGLINIKDFFWFKKGVSLTISETNMGRINLEMKRVTEKVRDADSPLNLFLAICGTIVLATLVNFIELGCTLILPVQYIEVLIANYGASITLFHILSIGFYCIIYVIPLFAILGGFLYTFKSERVSTAEGRALKLVSGIVMIALGLIMFFSPELLTFTS